MIFVTGATGFLGSHLLHDLTILDRPVRALYHNKERIGLVRQLFSYYHKDPGNLLNKIEWVQGDILDYYSLVDHMNGISQVYHCAGMVSFNPAEIRKMTDINVRGTTHVVNACLEQKIDRLCHVSSIAALGDSQDGNLIDESSLWSQESYSTPYSRSKYRSEMEVWRGIFEGLNAVIINPSVIIGPGIWSGPIPELYYLIKAGLWYYPTGASGFVDVRDVVRVMISLADSNIRSERFIVSAENRTLREVIGFFAESIQKPVPDHPLTPGMIRAACLFEKIRSFLTGKSPRVNPTSMRSASAITAYSNHKIVNALSFAFIPVKEAVSFSSRFYREELEKSGKI